MNSCNVYIYAFIHAMHKKKTSKHTHIHIHAFKYVNITAHYMNIIKF